MMGASWSLELDTSHKSAVPDSAKGYGNVGVDLHNYVYGNNPSNNPGTIMQDEVKPSAEVVTNYKDTSGQYIVHRYKTVFTPDVIIGSAGYSGFFGLQGTTQMLFSDELGNQQIFFATNLIINLKNSDYLGAYYNLADRTSWGIQGYHSAAFVEEVSDPSAPTDVDPVARFTSSGLSGVAAYPIQPIFPLRRLAHRSDLPKRPHREPSRSHADRVCDFPKYFLRA